MNKIAQRRGIFNKLREMTNVSGIAAEKFFNPQFEEVMDTLRAVDGNVRSIVAGKQLDGGDPGQITRSLKDILASAKSNLNRREYMTTVAELGRFHSKMREILTEFQRLHQNLDKVHHQFLFQDLDEEHKKELQNLQKRWAARQDALVKEAFGESIKDFLHNALNERGRALGFYEKRYPKQVRALKAAAGRMITRSQAALGIILSALKDMASARAARNPDRYVQAASKIEKAYGAYDASFKEFYNGNVKEYERFFKANPELAKEAPAGEETGDGSSEEPRDTDPGMSPPSGVGDRTTHAPTGDTVPPEQDTYRPTGDSDVPTPMPAIPKARSKEFGPDIENYMNQLHQIQQDSNAPTEHAPPPSGVPGVPGASSPQPPPKSGPTMMGVAPQANPPKNLTIPYGPGMSTPAKSAHQNFYESLEAMSGEHPHVVAAYISKYASLIQYSDPTTAIQLFKIAKSVRG